MNSVSTSAPLSCRSGFCPQRTRADIADALSAGTHRGSGAGHRVLAPLRLLDILAFVYLALTSDRLRAVALRPVVATPQVGGLHHRYDRRAA